MANGLTTPANGGVSWLDVIDRNLQGWLGYFSSKKDPVVANASPFGTPSQSDVQLALLQSQVQQQQQMQTYLLLAAGAVVVLYLVTAK